MDDEDKEKLLALLLVKEKIIISIAIAHLSSKKRKPRRWGTRPIFQNRQRYGNYYTLVPQMRTEDVDCHQNYFRMSPENFDILLRLVDPLIKTQHATRDVIPTGLMLALTIR